MQANAVFLNDALRAFGDQPYNAGAGPRIAGGVGAADQRAQARQHPAPADVEKVRCGARQACPARRLCFAGPRNRVQTLRFAVRALPFRSVSTAVLCLAAAETCARARQRTHACRVTEARRGVPGRPARPAGLHSRAAPHANLDNYLVLSLCKHADERRAEPAHTAGAPALARTLLSAGLLLCARRSGRPAALRGPDAAEALARACLVSDESMAGAAGALGRACLVSDWSMAGAGRQVRAQEPDARLGRGGRAGAQPELRAHRRGGGRAAGAPARARGGPAARARARRRPRPPVLRPRRARLRGSGAVSL